MYQNKLECSSLSTFLRILRAFDRLDGEKRSSLLFLTVSDEEVKFHNIDTKASNGLKACLHCGDNRSKLVRFKERKIFFSLLSGPILERFSPQ